MPFVTKHSSHRCGKTIKPRKKRYSDCVRVLNTQKKPQYGKTHCSWCHKFHKCRLLFQSKQGYDHCCSVECIVMVKQYYGYEQEETSEPLLMLCPDCSNVTIDTTKVKLCLKCVKKYPTKSRAAYGY